MRVNTFMFLLIAGILSSAMSSEYEPNQPRVIESILQLHDLVSGDEQSEAVLKLLKESCEKNNEPKAFNTAKKGVRLFFNCSAQSRVSKMHHTSTDLIDSIMKEHCAKGMIVANCLKPFENSIEPCLDSEEREITKIFFKLIESLVEFICDGDGARIEKFLADGGAKCFLSKQQALQNCMKEISTDNEFESAYSFDGQSIEGIQQGLRDLIPTAKDCIRIEKLQLCTVKVLNKCEHHTPADIVNALFNSIRKAVDCKGSIASQASTADVANFMLLTALMAICLRFA